MHEHDHEIERLIEAGAERAESAGPLPEGVRGRLKARRASRRMNIVAGLAVVVFAGVVAVNLSLPVHEPSAEFGPVVLRFDDPMFEGLDAKPPGGASTDALRIGSFLTGDLPEGL